MGATAMTGPAAAGAVRARLAGVPLRWYLVAAALVLAVLVWLVAFSSVLGVRSVNVLGARTLTAAQVRAAAGISPGTPLARLDSAAVRRRLAALTPISAVTVSTSYPSSVTIRITERVAVGYRPDSGAVVLVDRDDVAFHTVKSAPAGLPRLLVPGDDARSGAAAQVAGTLPPQVAGKVGSISAPSEESVTLTLTDGRTVLWGGTDRSADKAKLLPVLIAQPGTYFDLSDPSAVISRGAPTGGGN